MIHTRTIPLAVALSLAFLLLLTLVLIAEIGQAAQGVISGVIERSQQRQALIASVLHDVTAAEAAQRAWLLAGDRRQLGLYDSARDRLTPTLEQLLALSQRDVRVPALREEAASIQQLRNLTQTQLGQLSAAFTQSSTGAQQPLQLLRTELAQPTMGAINDAAATLLGTERELVDAQLARAARLRVASRALLAAVALLDALLLLGAAMALMRRARRRGALTEPLTGEDEELERRVRRRTAELSALSSHLQQLAEKEKALLARELHDELGGLLIAVKMDASWLQKRWPNPAAEVQSRWARVLKVLDDGVDFKRRVVEGLRPTLLDNMGLLPAARWITQEICSRAGLRYTEIYPEQEPQLTEDAAIMVFRLIQEALTNVVKHAHATHARLQIGLSDQEMTVLIEDNGIGIEPERRDAIGSHGLAIMRHRVRAGGGSLEIGVGPDGGTRIAARLPLASIAKASAPMDQLLTAVSRRSG